MIDSPRFSVFYLGGPLDGTCRTRSFTERLQIGRTLSQILSVEPSAYERWLQTGEAGATRIVRADYQITHINGFVAVARFTGNNTTRICLKSRCRPGDPQD